MNKLAVIRLGSDFPLPKEFPIINTISNDMELPTAGLGLRGIGVLSLFYTPMSPSEVKELYRQVEEETGDCLPILILNLDSEDCAIGFQDKYEQFGQAIKFFKERIEEMETGNEAEPEPEQFNRASSTVNTRKVETLQLDDLLDLINKRGGIEKLTTEERARLEELTK